MLLSYWQDANNQLAIASTPNFIIRIEAAGIAWKARIWRHQSAKLNQPPIASRRLRTRPAAHIWVETILTKHGER